MTLITDSDIRAIGEWNNNADMIVAAATLGYIEGDVLDLTYGEGAFWRDHCGHITSNDRYRPADHSYDFRATGFGSASFDTVVFDPPYKLQGTPASDEMDLRYGISEARSRSEIHALIVGGVAEASRLTRKWLLVKCQDQVSSGQVRWQTDLVTDVARVLELRKVDALHLQGGRPQPEGRRQVHARRNYSTLLIFQRRGGTHK